MGASKIAGPAVLFTCPGSGGRVSADQAGRAGLAPFDDAAANLPGMASLEQRRVHEAVQEARSTWNVASGSCMVYTNAGAFGAVQLFPGSYRISAVAGLESDDRGEHQAA